ncbi:MAG: hypothetical protein ACKOC5_01600 [Chloroflexota bacterium]
MLTPWKYLTVWLRAPGVLLAAAALLGLLVITPLASFGGASAPTALVYGPQDAFWATLRGQNAVAQLNLPGSLVTTSLATADAYPHDLAIGPDQALWLTERSGEAITRLDPLDHSLSRFALPQPGGPAALALGQDEALWFTELDGDRIGRLGLVSQPDGSLAPGEISRFALPTPGSAPHGIAAAPDGSLWFSEWGAGRIGRITPQGDLSEYLLPWTTHHPTELAFDPDGGLWFILDVGPLVGHIDPAAGTIVSYTLSTASSSLLDLAAGPDGRMWFLGVQSLGSFALTAGSPSDLQEIAIPAMFQGQGRAQLIAGPGAEINFIRLDSPQLYNLALPDPAALRDLQVFFTHLPPTLLAGGPFTVTVELVNWSSDPATGVKLSLQMGEGISFTSSSLPSTCSTTGQLVECPLAQLDGKAHLPVTFTLQMKGGLQTTLSLDARVSAEQGDYLPANNRVFRSVEVLRSLVYFTDFEAGADDLWSEQQVVGQPGGGQALGPLANTLVTLRFANLPPHDRVRLCYDLYIRGEWDGFRMTDPADLADPPQVVGPDLWSNYLDERPLLATSFSNRSGWNQSFPAGYPAADRLPQSGALETGDFGGGGAPAVTDARYHLCFDRPHSPLSMVLTFYGNHLDLLSGESWTLDNVSVEFLYTAAYQWLYMPLISR